MMRGGKERMEKERRGRETGRERGRGENSNSFWTVRIERVSFSCRVRHPKYPS